MLIRIQEAQKNPGPDPQPGFRDRLFLSE